MSTDIDGIIAAVEAAAEQIDALPSSAPASDRLRAARDTLAARLPRHIAAVLIAAALTAREPAATECD